jgi:hypothetical protein
MKTSLLVSTLLLANALSISAQNLPEQRAHHALVYDEKSLTVKLTAGSSPRNNGNSFLFFDDVWSYDGKGWKKENAVADQRSGVALAYDPKNESIVSLGGFSNNNQSLSDLRELKDNVWRTLDDKPELKMTEGGFVYDNKRDRFIAFGGGGGRSQPNADTWIWDRKTWTKISGPSPDGRQAFAMVYDSKRDRVVAFGGMGSIPQKIFGVTWVFDGQQWNKF